MAEYSFTKTGVVNSKLAAEIKTSMSIDVKIHTRGTTVYINTPSDLSAGDQTTLSGIVTAHNGNPLRDKNNSSFWVKEYTDSSKSKLLTHACYLNRSGNTFSNPVCKMVYTYNGSDVLTTVEHYRYYTDGTEELFKTVNCEEVTEGGSYLVIES